MRTLQVLGLTSSPTDGDLLVCQDPETGDKFGLPADERLRAAARGDISRLGQLEIEMESQLRPREIQARIRAGATVAQVAVEAGTDASRIERYAYPVLLERSTIAERGQQAHPMVGGVPARKRLGELVAAVLADRGQLAGITWDAFKDDTGWVLALRWKAGRSENRAHWGYHPGPDSGTVTAKDEHAASLIDPAPRPLRTVGAVTDRPADRVLLDAPTQELPKVSADAAQPHARRTPEPVLPAAPATENAVTDRFADRAVAAGADSDVDARPAVDAGAGRVEPGADGSSDLVDVVEQTVLDDRAGVAGRATEQEQPARTGTDSATGAAGSPSRKPRSGGRQRPVMPSWEDILLGGKGGTR